MRGRSSVPRLSICALIRRSPRDLQTHKKPALQPCFGQRRLIRLEIDHIRDGPGACEALGRLTQVGLSRKLVSDIDVSTIALRQIMRHSDTAASSTKSTGTRIGYTRVSTVAQTLDQQNGVVPLDASIARHRRPSLAKLKAVARPIPAVAPVIIATCLVMVILSGCRSTDPETDIHSRPSVNPLRTYYDTSALRGNLQINHRHATQRPRMNITISNIPGPSSPK